MHCGAAHAALRRLAGRRASPRAGRAAVAAAASRRRLCVLLLGAQLREGQLAPPVRTRPRWLLSGVVVVVAICRAVVGTVARRARGAEMVVARHDLCPHCSQLFTAEFSRYNTHTSMLYRIPQRAPDGTLTAQFSRYNTHSPYYTGSHSAPLMPSAAFSNAFGLQ